MIMALGVRTILAQDGPLSLTLGKAIELGLENDEALRQANLAVAGARAEVMQAKSNALPHLTIS